MKDLRALPSAGWADQAGHCEVGVVAGADGELALLAEAGHMLTDAGALAGSIWAIRRAARPGKDAWTFGFQRAEILSAPTGIEWPTANRSQNTNRENPCTYRA